ncbi:MAG: HIT domain-containing protein [Candidatus Omnitrophica bacterium]|nr:HIT domain-containing protein [Candidatus Omnitrophota bacterium]
MDNLWAPWRIKYIQAKKTTGCIFCQKPRQKKDKANFIVKRGKFVFSILNIFPYNNGHTLIVPYRHIDSLEKMNNDELIEMFEFIKYTTKQIKSKMNAQGFNIGLNIGKVAGAGIDKHLHIHIVPRWEADTNFMPVISGTKIISQSLEELFNILKS